MRWLLACTLLFSAVSLASAADRAPVEKQWDVGGVARKAIVYAPARAKETSTPLVFAFHGHGGTMQQAARSFGYHTLWPEAIVVYMQGLNTAGKLTDPEGRRPGWQHGRGDEGDRDLKFFDAVLASLQEEYKVDAKRIYATGHSNGGSFTYLLWATRGDTFAAVAPSGALLGVEAKNLQPKPMLHIAGKSDPLVKWTWQEQMIQMVQKRNDCAAQGEAWDKAGDVVATEYKSKTGNPVVTALHPGGHRFPTEAAKMAVKFFQQHPAAKP